MTPCDIQRFSQLYDLLSAFALDRIEHSNFRI